MSFSMFGCDEPIVQICLVPADIGNGRIFGISEYLSACAILFVILTISDFRYRLRLEISALGRKAVFGSSAAIGILIALSEVWFANSWPIFAWASNLSVVQAVLGGAFIIVILYAGWVVLIRPPIFSELNAHRFASAYYFHIGSGDHANLSVLASELAKSIRPIFEQALQINPDRRSREVEEIAWELITILGDRRFCKALVESGAWTIDEIFHVLGSAKAMCKLPASELVTNISAELLTNPISPLMAELRRFSYGYFEASKPITQSVYGDADLLDAVSPSGGPLEVWRTIGFHFEPQHLENYAGALKIFCESYFQVQKWPAVNNRTLYNALADLGRINMDLYKVDGIIEGITQTVEVQKLQIIVSFLSDIIEIMDKSEVKTPEWHDEIKGSIHELVAQQCVEVIFHSSAVTGPPDRAWAVHHNIVWVGLFGYHKSRNARVIQRLVRRILFDEIQEMDHFPNYRSARLLGFVLSIYGLSERRHYIPSHHPLKAVAVRWARQNYLRMKANYPDVANAVLIGSITFDDSREALVKSYAKGIRSEPTREFLALSPHR